MIAALRSKLDAIRERFRSRAELEAEVARLRELWRLSQRLQLRDLSMQVEDEQLVAEMAIEPNLTLAILSESLGRLLDEHGGPNYAEIGVNIQSPWRGRGKRADYTVIVVRTGEGGKSPHIFRKEAEARETILRAAFNDAIAILEAHGTNATLITQIKALAATGSAIA